MSLGLGGEGFGRALLAASKELPNGMTLLGALEHTRNNGPWEISQGLRRTNGIVTLSSGTLAQGMSVSLMGFDSRWRATDQVPQRLLDAGTLNRFGTVDSSDAGSTSRYSLSTQWRGGNALGPWRVSAYAMRYQLQLYSNFTYALNRPVDGDQILQEDARKVFGLNAQQTVFHTLAGLPARTQFGLQVRHDRITVGLFDTVQRTVQATTRRDRVRETAAAFFADTQVTWTPWLRTVAGVRADRMMAAVVSQNQALNSGQSHGGQISPKFTAVLGPWAQTEFFVNAGRGFHSNDARGTTQTIDPATSAPVDKTKVFESSRGAEIGVRSELIEGVQSSLALWRLHSQSELVFAGDSGTTEASRPSKRQGIEWNTRWTATKWLLLDADFAWSRARFSDENPAGNAVPNAVNQVASLGATIKNLGPWSANLQGRYIGSAALIEDNSVRSKPSFLTSLRVARQFGSQVEMTLDVFNLFNRKVNDIEYYYASQLKTEIAPVLDKHVHPAQPRTLRIGLAVKL